MNDNIFLERFEAGKEEVAKNLLKEGIDLDVIASCTGFTVGHIKKL